MTVGSVMKAKSFIDPKRVAGDGATPEGVYRVTRKKSGGETRYYKALLLSYPNAEDRERFERERALGRIAADALIGSLIEIHGEGGRGKNWTDGCVALTNDEMDELFEAVDGESEPPGEAEIRELKRQQRDLRSLVPHGVYVVVDTSRNRLYVKKGETTLHEAVCSTGSGVVLRDPDTGRSWLFDTPTGVSRSCARSGTRSGPNPIGPSSKRASRSRRAGRSAATTRRSATSRSISATAT